MDIKPIEWKDWQVLDFSSIDQFLSCGEQFRRVKLGERQPPSIAMFEGTSTHLACSTNNLNKRDKGKDLPASKLIDVSMHNFESTIKKPEVKDTLEVTKQEINDMFDRAKKWFPEYITKYAPTIQPEWVEQPVRKEVSVQGVNFELSGVIDLTTKPAVIDYKTSSSIKSQSEVDSSLQLSLYSMFASKLDVGMLVFVKTKNPYVAYIPSKRSPADHQWALLVASRVMQSVRKGCFPFANPTPQNWRCTEKFCGFWSSCRGRFVSISQQVLSEK